MSRGSGRENEDWRPFASWTEQRPGMTGRRFLLRRAD
jgi:hypothetical protein